MDTLVPVIHVHGDIAHFFLDLQVSQALWRVTVSFDPSCTQVDQLCVNTSVFPACHRGLSFRKCWCAVISLRPSLHDQQVPYWASINWLLRRLLPPLSSLFYNFFYLFFWPFRLSNSSNKPVPSASTNCCPTVPLRLTDWLTAKSLTELNWIALHQDGHVCSSACVWDKWASWHLWLAVAFMWDNASTETDHKPRTVTISTTKMRGMICFVPVYSCRLVESLHLQSWLFKGERGVGVPSWSSDHNTTSTNDVQSRIGFAKTIATLLRCHWCLCL